MKDASSELARINHKGEAHPIGVTASRRMRARVGAYRVLPAPEHVVFMRYTGEDGRRDEEDGAVVRLAGEITAPAALCDVLAMMAHTRWRGELLVMSNEGTRSIYMENANVVGAGTTIAEERIGSIMFRYGALDEREIALVLRTKRDEARFGEAAVELGYVDGEQLYELVGKQIEAIVFGALEVDDGTFFFLDGFDADRLASHHTFSATMLLMDGVTRLDEIRYFRNKIPSADWVPIRTELGSPPAQEYAAVHEAIDGSRSVLDIGRHLGHGEFDTTKAIYALAQSNHVEVHPPRMAGGAAALVAAANAALRSIHQRVDAAGKGTIFRATLAGFATGGGVYDMLFMGAGPDDRGALAAEVVCNNVERMAEEQPEAYLKAKLHEYVGFGVFTTGSLLGSEAEQELSLELQDTMATLQPSPPSM